MAPREELTLDQLAAVYLARHPRADRSRVGVVCRTVVPTPTGRPAALGAWRVRDVVVDTLEQFRAARRAVSADAGTNRNLAQLRAVLRWGVAAATSTPRRSRAAACRRSRWRASCRGGAG